MKERKLKLEWISWNEWWMRINNEWNKAAMKWKPEWRMMAWIEMEWQRKNAAIAGATNLREIDQDWMKVCRMPNGMNN